MHSNLAAFSDNKINGKQRKLKLNFQIVSVTIAKFLIILRRFHYYLLAAPSDDLIRFNFSVPDCLTAQGIHHCHNNFQDFVVNQTSELFCSSLESLPIKRENRRNRPEAALKY